MSVEQLPCHACLKLVRRSEYIEEHDYEGDKFERRCQVSGQEWNEFIDEWIRILNELRNP